MPFLWMDVVNSRAHDHTGRGRDEDRLEDRAWARALRERWNLGRVSFHEPETHRRLVRMRSLLSRLAAALAAEEPLPARDLDAINRHIAARPVLRPGDDADGGYHVDLVPTGRGADGLLHAIAMSFAEFLVDHDPTRLRICENDDCRWVFYDETRSRTRRWCAPTCGTLIKVRQFRERERKKSRRKTR
jgi:predicted RNA-binding Zn ribbon-like protein